MVINIWAGESPNYLKYQDSINILINSLSKPHPEGQVIHLISDPRYTKSVKGEITPASNFEDILFIAESADDKLFTKNFRKKIIYKILGRDGFSSDITKGVYHGCSTVYIGIQLALFLGGKEINIYGSKYSYGRRITRPSNLFDLPDPLISETQRVIERHKNQIMKLNAQVFFIGTIL